MFLNLRFSAIALTLSTAAISVAHSAPIVYACGTATCYFGENQTPGGLVTVDPPAARASFLANLNGVGSEGFESFPLGNTTSFNVSFTGSAGAITASLNGDGEIRNSSTAGRFNTTPGGSKWFQQRGTSGQFEIVFSTAIAAFGFYATDVGDFDGRVTLSLFDSADSLVRTVTVPNTVQGNDASLLFYGFIDSTQSYKRIAFGNTQAGVDIFGFDDMVVGDINQIGPLPPGRVPEPATLALVGLSLAGLAAATRRKAHK